MVLARSELALNSYIGYGAFPFAIALLEQLSNCCCGNRRVFRQHFLQTVGAKRSLMRCSIFTSMSLEHNQQHVLCRLATSATFAGLCRMRTQRINAELRCWYHLPVTPGS